MNMKNRIGLIVALMCGTVCAVAQTGAPVGRQADPEKIMGTEAEDLVQTINGYVQGAMHRGYLELTDRKKGEQVTLRLDRIVLDDPERMVFPMPGRVALCGECTQVELVKQRGRATRERELEDQYDVWFVVQRRGDRSRAKVIDIFIKSVNGNTMFFWTQDTEGQWTATLVPDEPS
jgi:hypothetical protein